MVDTGFEKIGEFFEEISEEIPDAIAKSTFRIAVEATGLIERSARKKMPGGTGDLGRSFKAEFVSKEKGEVSAGSFSDLVYAPIQEFGGVIRPRIRRALAIPLTPKARRIGPREWGGTLQFIKSRKGNAILATIQQRKRGKDVITPQYVLKKSVTLQPKAYIEDIRDDLKQTSEEVLGKDVIKTFEGE